ncbi:MAG TPA: SDR family oxidoreductase [Gemmatimonadaceae bacterium]|jgi:3-oxoacyl-[acyl-carrier protein] reductase|nr:SDR family oxidoreductase [Gemmatimonadaceae bacterium]
MIGLKGKRALVTGGSRGIGAAVTELLAEQGVHVAIGYRSRSADADRLVASLRQEHGVTAFAHAADISTMHGADDLVARAADALGGLDFFVGNAGVWQCDDVPLGEMTDGQWRRTMAENVDSIFYTTRAVVRRISDNGRIVLVSSTAGQRGEALHADYAASKGATISFVKSLAPELGKRGVTVNSVAPGWVDTEMCAPVFADGGRDRIAAGIPVGRIAAPRDIAGPIVFLCSELARHITGEIVNVNGGSVLCG